MQNTTLGIGIMGMGAIGAIHAKSLAQLEGVVLRAYSGGTLSSIADFGWPAAEKVSPHDLLTRADVELVVVCTPSALHAEHSLAALRAGKHVVVEKPFSVDVESGRNVVIEAEARGLFVSVMAQRRTAPEMHYVRGLIQRGELGRVVLGEALVHWFRDDEYYSQATWKSSMAGGGGSLFNQGLHDIDLLRWLLGPVTRVTAQYATLGREMDAEDTTVATLHFASGALGTIVTSTATPPGLPSELSIFTERGSLSLAQGEVRRWSIDGIPPPPSNLTPSGAAQPLAIGITGHVRQWSSILNDQKAGRVPLVSAIDGLETVALIRSIYESAATGRAIDIAPQADQRSTPSM